MAYIKEFLKEEDRRTFVSPSGRKITTRSWTIDKEKDAILFCDLEDREPPHVNYFIFYYKGHLIEFMMHQRIFIEPNIVKWKLISISVPEELNRAEVMSELREAFLAYGYDGSIFWDDSRYVFEFEGE